MIKRNFLKVLPIGASLLAFVALFTVLTAVRPAAAQAACGERSGLVEQLARSHGEGPVSMGLTADGRVLELLASPRGSWSILVTTANGLTCLVAAGKYWKEVAVSLGGPGA